MKQRLHISVDAVPPLFQLGSTVVLLAVVAVLVGASSARAAYQQVGTFGGTLTAPIQPGVFPEEAQLDGLSRMAVNVNGAGGVSPGTVYTIGVDAIGDSAHDWSVARFTAHGEFREALRETGRCGPEVPPIPPSTTYPVCSSPQGASYADLGVSVDQATGDVYVYHPGEAHKDVVSVYSPDGATLIAQFGERVPPGSTTAETPEHIHEFDGGMVVNEFGEVYVADLNSGDHFYHRLMVFRPQTPGDYENYVYAGQGRDIGSGIIEPGKEGTALGQPTLGPGGDIYTAGENKINEFDPSQPAAPICTFTLASAAIDGMAVDPDTGDVFFYDYKDKTIHQLSPCNAEGKFVELEGAAISPSPERGYLAALAFNPTLRYETSRPVGVLYGATGEPVPVASNGGEPGQSGLGYIFAPPIKREPEVQTEWATNVLSTAATIHATIDPRGSSTRYYFQYLTEIEYEANEPSERFAGANDIPTSGASVGSGSAPISTGETLSGLVPETTYRYRTVASSAEGTVYGATMSLRTHATEGVELPDGRAYELVSPIEKHGGEVFPENPELASCGSDCKPGRSAERFPLLSATSGEAVAYEGTPFSNGDATGEDEYRAERTSTGWQTTTISSPIQQSGEGSGVKAFDGKLTQALIYQWRPALTPNAPAEYANLYLQPTENPLMLTPLLDEAPPDRQAGGSFRLTYAGASTDLSRIFFEANDALTGEMPFAPAAVDGGEEKGNLYEWAEGQLRLVNVAPTNESTAPGAKFGSGTESQLQQNDLSHAISANGSRVFWSSETGQVFVRESNERTVEIPDHTARFLTAANDGSLVLLTDGRIYGHLESEQPIEEADLSKAKGGFQGIVGQSEDLSHIYFVDTAVLDETPNSEGKEPQAGQDNLYYWHEGATVFITTLLKADNEAAGQEGDWKATPSYRTGEASPGGGWVAFLSEAQLTGVNNMGACKNNHEGGYTSGPCDEVFLYDAATGKLICESCNSSGEAPLGSSHLPTITGAGALLQPHYLTDSGRLLFDSRDSLSPRDTNKGVEDVYEAEPERVGSCARAEGCVSLISAGTGTFDSNFLAMDESGKNIFFTTRDQLVGADDDQAIDLYDAREGGGIAAESEAKPTECTGEICQGTASAQQVGTTPGSVTFTGDGNLLVPQPGMVGGPSAKTKTKTSTRAQKLAIALKRCKIKSRKARLACERGIRKKYDTTPKKVVNDRKGGR